MEDFSLDNEKKMAVKISNKLIKYAKRVTGFSTHCMRRSFATKLKMMGVNIDTIQNFMGHSSPEVTNMYISDEVLNSKAVQDFEKVIIAPGINKRSKKATKKNEDNGSVSPVSRMTTLPAKSNPSRSPPIRKSKPSSKSKNLKKTRNTRRK